MPVLTDDTIDGLTILRGDLVTEVVINRPARKNAITLAMWGALANVFENIGHADGVRAVVLSGADGNFSAGADISEFDTERGNAASARNYEAANSRAFAAVRNCQVPVVAAISGICFGGGFGLAAAADVRLASPDAIFCVPAAKLGLAYPQDAMIDIVSSLGPQLARYLAFTGARIDAAQALTSGFLLELADRESLGARASQIATSIAVNAPLSVRASKLAIAATLGGDTQLAKVAQTAGDVTFESADYAEGRAAFKEKRTPEFHGS